MPTRIGLNTEKYRKWLQGQGAGYQGKDLLAAGIAKDWQNRQDRAIPASMLHLAQPYDTFEAGLAAPPITRAPTVLPQRLQIAREFWSTPEFGQYVQEIIKSRNIADNSLDANSRHPSPGLTGVSRVQELYRAPKVAPVGAPKAGISANLAAVLVGQRQEAPGFGGKPYLSPKEYAALVAKQNPASAIPAGIKQPRFVFDMSGNPLEIYRSYAEIVAQIRADNIGHPIRTWWNIVKYNAALGLAEGVKVFAGPATGVMEISPKTIVGAVRDLVFNAIMSGVSGYASLGAGIMASDEAALSMKQRAYNIRQEAQRMALDGDTNATPAEIKSMLSYADSLDANATRIMATRAWAIASFSKYSTGLKNSWNNMMGVVSGKDKLPERPTPIAARDPQAAKMELYHDPESGLNYEAGAWKKWQETIASQKGIEADSHDLALQSYGEIETATSQEEANLLALRAVDQQATSIEARYSLEIINPLDSYTWASEPDKRIGMMKDLAVFELQVGRPVTMSELQNIKDHWVNPWTDGIGQAIFDPLWLVPEAAWEKVFAPVKLLAGKGAAAIKGSEFMQKFFFAEAHTSVANRLGRMVYDTVGMMRGGYTGGIEHLIDDMPKVGSIALEVDRRMGTAAGVEAAREYYEVEKLTVEGLKRVNFDDFLKFQKSFKSADGAFLLDPAEWGNLMRSGEENAIKAYRDRAFTQFRRQGMSVDEAWTEVEKNANLFKEHVGKTDDAINYFRSKIESAYLDPHKSFPGSRLIDDTLTGAWAKAAVKGGNRGLAQTLDTGSMVLSAFRNLWSSAVLNLNPSRIIRNLIDSTFRDVVYGGNVIDDLDTLLRNTHLMFADDVGFIPVEFGQSLARAGLDMDQSVPFKLLYDEKNKPRFGLYSYWRQEVDRLGLVDSGKIAAGIGESMSPQGSRLFKNIWNGMKAVPSAFADVNTAIEFTLRLRMFHREYFNLLRTMEPEILRTVMADLSPEARRLAQEAWDVGGGNAAKMASYIDSATLRADFIDKAHPAWSYSLPDNFGGKMSNPELFISHVRSNTDQWIEGVYKKTGKRPTNEMIDKYIADSIESFEHATADQISQTAGHRGVSGQMGSDVSDMPLPDDLGGSAPVFERAHPATVVKVKEAPKPLIPRGRVKSMDVINNYRDEMLPIASVNRYSGNVPRVHIGEQGRIYIDIPDTLKQSKVADVLHDSTIQAFSIHDEQFIREVAEASRRPGSIPVSWTNKEEWVTGFKNFLKDPLKIYNEKPADFLTYVRQMERNPEMFDVISRTGIGKNRVQSYEQAAIVMRRHGYLEEVREMPANKYFGLLEHEEQIAHPRPLSYLQKGDESSYATGKFSEAIIVKEGDPNATIMSQISHEGSTLIDRLGSLRDKYRDYLRLIEPGPHRSGVEGSLAQRLWDKFFQIRGLEYESRGRILNPIRKLIEDKRFTDALEDLQKLTKGNLPELFLQKQGYAFEWNDDATKIVRGTLMDDGVERALSEMEITGLQKRFFEYDPTPHDPVRTLDITGAEMSVGKQIKEALVGTFGFKDRTAGTITGMIKSQADWGVQFGRTADEFYEGLGFTKVSKGWQVKKIGENLEALKKGLIMKDPLTDRIMMMGVGSNNLSEFARQYTVLLYDDWAKIAAKNPTFKTEYFDPILEIMGSKGGTPTVEQLNKLADTFVAVIAGGRPSTVRIARPFDAYSKILANAYEGILRNQDLLDLPPDVVAAINKMFISSKMSAPPVSAAPRVAKMISKELGVNVSEEQIIAMTFDSMRKKAAFIHDPYNPNKFLEWAKTNKGMSTEDAYKAWVNAGRSELDNLHPVVQEYFADDAFWGEGGAFALRPAEEAEKMFPYKTIAEFTPNMDWNTALETLRSRAKNTNQEVMLTSQMEAGFNEWKQGRFSGFPDSATTDPDTLIKYLKDRSLSTTDTELKQQYQDMVWTVEQFQQDMTTHFSGRNLMGKRKAWDEYEIRLNEEMKKLSELIDNPETEEAARYEARTRMSMIRRIRDTGEAPEELMPIYRATERNLQTRGNWWTTNPSVTNTRAGMTTRTANVDIAYIPKSEWEAAQQKAIAENARRGTTGIDPEEGIIESLPYGFFTEADLPGGRLTYEGVKPLTWTEKVPTRITSKDLIAPVLSPRVPESAIDDGVVTWIRNNVANTNSLEAGRTELKRLGEHLKSGAGFSRILPNDIKSELQAWKLKAINEKNGLVSKAMNGDGAGLEGAIAKVNRVMLDYNYRMRIDNVMRNIIPFWQFPSRSFPFWAEALATHPQIIAGYQKLQNLSRQTRFQAGAITSSGRPLPSLDGFIPVPGTDLWFNPVAPLSFIYMLGAGQSPEDVLNQTQNAHDDVPPVAAVAQEFLSMSPVYGISPAPWITGPLKKWLGLSDAVAPPWPITPQIPLMPRWWEQELVHKLNDVFAHIGYPHAADWMNSVYPEVSWHDYLVERQMLTDLKARLGTLNNVDQMYLANQVARAIKEKGKNALWQEAYRTYTESEASRSQGAFLTGFYTKPFTDADADMLALRNQNNLMKSTMNSKFQSALFDIPIDANQAWSKYLDAQNTPEGWIYKLYTEVGYVRNPGGLIETDPAKRAQLLAQRIQQDENEALYYQKVTSLQQTLQAKLKAAGVGAPFDVISPIYDEYYAGLGSIQHLSNYQTGFGTNKPAAIIEQQLTDKWFRMINHTKPVWDAQGGETYDQWQMRVDVWKEQLPETGKFFLHFFTTQGDVEDIVHNLRPDQQLSNNFFGMLVEMTNAQGLDQWQLGRDSIFDAMNKAYEELYWKPYWEALKDPTSDTGWKKGSAYEAGIQDFAAAHPDGPPTSEEMFAYMSQIYGTKFTLDQIRVYAEGGELWSIQKRLEQMHANDPLYQTKQDIYHYLSFAGPGKGRSLIMQSVSASVSTDIDNWLSSQGTLYDDDPEALAALRDALKTTVERLQKEQGLLEPTRDDLAVFVEAEEQNRQFQDLFIENLKQKGVITDWDTASKVLSKYYNDQKYFSTSYKADYNNIVLPYIQARSVWASKNPVWASVYMWAQSGKYYGNYLNYLSHKNDIRIPTMNLLGNASALTPPASFQSGFGPVHYENYGGVNWPVGMREAVSPYMVAEIQNVSLHPGNYRLSNSATAALNTLKNIHPEWEDFINPLLP